MHAEQYAAGGHAGNGPKEGRGRRTKIRWPEKRRVYVPFQDGALAKAIPLSSVPR